MCLYQCNNNVPGHALSASFSTTHWTFHFETASKHAVRHVIWVLQKCRHKHVLPMSLGWAFHISTWHFSYSDSALQEDWITFLLKYPDMTQHKTTVAAGVQEKTVSMCLSVCMKESKSRLSLTVFSTTSAFTALAQLPPQVSYLCWRTSLNPLYSVTRAPSLFTQISLNTD